MDVDRTRAAHDAVDHRAVDQLVEAGPFAGPEHDLRGVLRSGDIEQGGPDVTAGHLAILAADLLEQRRCSASVPDCNVCARRHRAAVGHDVNADEVTLGALGDPCRPPDQVLATRCSRQGHHDPLAGLPCAADAMPLAILGERVVDAVGDPQQCQLAECRQVAGAEIVGRARRRSCPPCRCCRAPCGGAGLPGPCRRARSGRRRAPRRSGTVSPWRMPVICSTTSLSDSRCWMLTVEMTSMPACSNSFTSCHRLGLREPGMLVWANSSMRTHAGRRRMMASTSISVNVEPRCSIVRRGTTSRSSTCSAVRARPCVST